MKLIYHMLFGLLSGLLSHATTQAQQAPVNTRPKTLGDTLLIRLAPGKHTFWADDTSNLKAMQRMSQWIQTNKPEIEAHQVKMRVIGLSSAFGSDPENLAAATDWGQQVISYFIVQDRLKQEHFQLRTSTQHGAGHNDLIAAAYLFDVHADDSVSRTSKQKSRPKGPYAKQTTHSEKTSNRWAIKTNLAYWAATVANIGVEYRFGNHYSIDLPILYSPYSVAQNYQLRILAIQPECRYWLHQPMKGHFFGAHLHVGAFNIAVDAKHRYQSPKGFYGLGVSYGYVLPIAGRWAAEFTIGAGYLHTKYDSYYNIPNGARYQKDTPYNYWGITRVGIGVAYHFGK